MGEQNPPIGGFSTIINWLILTYALLDGSRLPHHGRIRRSGRGRNRLDATAQFRWPSAPVAGVTERSETRRFSSVPTLDAPFIKDALDQIQPAAPFRMNARAARRHGRHVVVANLHPDARREPS